MSISKNQIIKLICDESNVGKLKFILKILNNQEFEDSLYIDINNIGLFKKYSDYSKKRYPILTPEYELVKCSKCSSMCNEDLIWKCVDCRYIICHCCSFCCNYTHYELCHECYLIRINMRKQKLIMKEKDFNARIEYILRSDKIDL